MGKDFTRQVPAWRPGDCVKMLPAVKRAFQKLIHLHTYAEAHESQELFTWTSAHVRTHTLVTCLRSSARAISTQGANTPVPASPI